jgi:N6-adenosine-specific RNA methylase IME4
MGLGTSEIRARVESGELAVHNAAELCRTLPPEKQRKIAERDANQLVIVTEQIRTKKAALAKRIEIEGQPLIIPEGRFSVIVIDPPWDLQKVAAGLVARDEEPELPYPTMDLDQIRKWGLTHFFPDVRVASDCHLFMWVPDHFLEVSFGLVRDWGFEPSRRHVWHKNTVHGLPGLPGYNSEFVLYARRGSPRFGEIAGSGFVTCFNGINQGHSRKPVEFYEMIRKVTPGARRIDVFSRSPHEGFEACGNEVDKFTLPEVPVGGPRIYTLEDLGL